MNLGNNITIRKTISKKYSLEYWNKKNSEIQNKVRCVNSIKNINISHTVQVIVPLKNKARKIFLGVLY